MTALRHTGSAGADKPGSLYGNQQYKATGTTRHCSKGDHWVSLGGGWKKYGPLKLWSCPACAGKAAAA